MKEVIANRRPWICWCGDRTVRRPDSAGRVLVECPRRCRARWRPLSASSQSLRTPAPGVPRSPVTAHRWAVIDWQFYYNHWNGDGPNQQIQYDTHLRCVSYTGVSHNCTWLSLILHLMNQRSCTFALAWANKLSRGETICPPPIASDLRPCADGYDTIRYEMIF